MCCRVLQGVAVYCNVALFGSAAMSRRPLPGMTRRPYASICVPRMERKRESGRERAGERERARETAKCGETRENESVCGRERERERQRNVDI